MAREESGKESGRPPKRPAVPWTGQSVLWRKHGRFNYPPSAADLSLSPDRRRGYLAGDLEHPIRDSIEIPTAGLLDEPIGQ
jgi:hypothetical protein